MTHWLTHTAVGRLPQRRIALALLFLKCRGGDSNPARYKSKYAYLLLYMHFLCTGFTLARSLPE